MFFFFSFSQIYKLSKIFKACADPKILISSEFAEFFCALVLLCYPACHFLRVNKTEWNQSFCNLWNEMVECASMPLKIGPGASEIRSFKQLILFQSALLELTCHTSLYWSIPVVLCTVEGLYKLRFAKHINLSYTHSTKSLERAHAFIMGLKRISGEKAGFKTEFKFECKLIYFCLRIFVCALAKNNTPSSTH